MMRLAVWAQGDKASPRSCEKRELPTDPLRLQDHRNRARSHTIWMPSNS